MNEAVIAAIISLIGVVISAVTSFSLVNWRLKTLEERVKEHNSYAKLFAESSKQIALIQKDIEHIKERLG